MKAKVDQSLCAGGQGCVNTCPQVFKMEGEKSTVYVDTVPEDAKEKCKSASDACPTAAITVEG
ncbi:MAG: ferredoxin [Desulfamplus sp.]|nr:ferredoxin [Desulfamplus sp.]